MLKKHLKKEDAVKVLKSRIIANIKEDTDHVDVDLLGEDIRAFLKKMEQNLTDVKMMKANGADIVDVGLRATTNDDLTQIKQILDTNRGGRRLASEEKIMKILPMIFANLRHLENAKFSIINCQKKVMHDLMNTFIDEFHTYHNGVANCDVASFEKKVEREVLRRDLVTVPEEGEQPNCVVF